MVHARLHDNGRLRQRPQVHPERRVLADVKPLVRRHDSIPAALSQLAEARPDAMLYVFVDAAGHYEVWRARRMVDRIAAFAGVLARDGVVPGDRVLLGIAEPLDLVTAWHACDWLGAAPVVYGRPLGRRRDGHWRREMVDLIDELRPRVVLVDDDFAERATVHLQVTDAVWRRIREVEDRLGEPVKPAGPGPTAFYALTQGSATGAPRPIGITPEVLLRRIDDLVAHCAGRTSDLACSWLPLNPRNGLVPTVLIPALYGVPSVLIDPLAFVFEPAMWLWAVHAFRASLSTAPGRGYQVCARAVSDGDLRDLDLSSWRLALVGGEMIHPEHLDGFCKRLAPAGFRDVAFTAVYGGAETLSMATLSPVGEAPRLDHIDPDRLSLDGVAVPGEGLSTTMVEVGGCLPELEVRIVDRRRRPVAERTLGCVELRTPLEARRHGRGPSDDPWLSTGDAGYLVDGRLVVCGRDTDLLRIAGRRVPAVMIERAIDRLEAIRWGCVIVDRAPLDAERSEPVVIFEHTATDRDLLTALEREVEAIFIDVVGEPPSRIVPVRQQGLPRAPNGQLRRARVLAMLKADVLPSPLPGLRLLR